MLKSKIGAYKSAPTPFTTKHAIVEEIIIKGLSINIFFLHLS